MAQSQRHRVLQYLGYFAYNLEKPHDMSDDDLRTIYDDILSEEERRVPYFRPVLLPIARKITHAEELQRIKSNPEIMAAARRMCERK